MGKDKAENKEKGKDSVKETKRMEKEAKSLIESFEAEINHGHYKAALSFLRDNLETIYSFYPEYAIDHDLALRIGLGDFDGAYEDLEEFSNRPYVRQSVEELLRDGKRRIREAERDYYESLSPSPRKKPGFNYSSELTDEQIAYYLQEKPKKDKAHIDFYLGLLYDTKRDNHIRSGAFIRLMELGYDKEVSFFKNGKTYTLVPANHKVPGENRAFQAVAKAMGKKRFSEFSDIPVRLLYLAELSLYPAELSSVADEETLIETFLCLCKSSFQQPFSFPSEKVEEAYARLYELIYNAPFPKSGGLGQA